MWHLSIDYDEEDETPYKGVVLKRKGPDGKPDVIVWNTGDPQKDWADYLDHAEENELMVMESSSITHFLFDVPGWRMILDEDEREIIVPEDRPGRDMPTELEPGMVFRDFQDEIVRLDQRVEGDGTQWVVDSWENGHWISGGRRIEPDDLMAVVPDPADVTPEP